MPKGNWGHKHYKGTGFTKGHKRLGGVLFEKGNHPPTEFVKGLIPWNKGKKGMQVSHRKGKKFPEYSGEKHPNWKGGISLAFKIKEIEKNNPRPTICEICGDEGIICYDHNHANGDFRGWVCSPCNCIMGFANDKIDKLKKIIKYLKKHAIKSI